MTNAYRANRERRALLRSIGVCIDCKEDNPTPEHWRCPACRAVESTKQIERNQRKTATTRVQNLDGLHDLVVSPLDRVIE